MTTLCMIDIAGPRDTHPLPATPAKKKPQRPPTKDEQQMDTDFDPDPTKPESPPPRRPS